jgi:ribosome-dependent ATPase
MFNRTLCATRRLALGCSFRSLVENCSSAFENGAHFLDGELAVAVEIPSGFGRDLASLHPPEVAVWIDGAMPFRGETAKGYVTGLGLRYAQDLVVERLGPNAVSNVYLGGLHLEDRFRYNQGFKSVFAMVPSVIVMMLILIPAIMASIAVVLEKETGSIANFRSTPITKFEFLLGKAFPYVVVGMLTFTLLLLMSFFVFHVPVKGSFAALAPASAASSSAAEPRGIRDDSEEPGGMMRYGIPAYRLPREGVGKEIG